MRTVGVGVMLVMLVAACSSSPSSPSGTGQNATTAHESSIGRGSLHAATLDLESGATSVEVTAANLGDRLLDVSTPSGSGQRPVTALSNDGVAHVQLASTGAAGVSLVDVRLAEGLTWTVDLDGGATDERIDLRGTQVAAVDLGSGASRETVSLPAPKGTEVLRVDGGASALNVGVPSGVATRVHLTGGAGSVSIGSTTHSGIGGDTTYDDPAYQSSANRVDLEIRSGVSQVDVHREQ